jgi:hypothetical protein
MGSRKRSPATVVLTREELEAIKVKLARLDAELCRLLSPPQSSVQPGALEPPAAGVVGAVGLPTGLQATED